ncbi:MAG: EAL domain-containing protein [Pseudobdellovibrio sp.]|nr:EAL domain-containing protein [Pseudobdellovibrio sp.]
MSTLKKQISIAKDTVLFKQGEAGDCAYVVESGKVLVYLEIDQKVIPLTHIKKGEIFGEMSLIDSLPRSASVKAVEDTVLNVVTKDQLIERFQGSDQLVQLLLKVMMNRVRKNNSSLTHGSEDNMNQDDTVMDGFENLKFENRLQEALNNQEFEMFYQPIVNMQDSKVVGAEALIRWKDPVIGYIQPDKFIDFLENSSLMVSVGHWIFERCFQDFHKIKGTFGDDFIMSINVSGRQFTHPDFLMDLEKLTWKHKVNPKNIKLEVTERVMMNGVVAIEILDQCKNKGFHISIDDFGTGYSSLQYLSQMPVSYLKIDKSFVSKVNADPKVLAVVKSMVFMAQALGMDIIAEGVETLAERESLLQLGAYYAQGWLYSKALPLDLFMKLPVVILKEKAA